MADEAGNWGYLISLQCGLGENFFTEIVLLLTDNQPERGG